MNLPPADKWYQIGVEGAEILVKWRELSAMVLGGAFLVWCVLTKSLPYIWAETDPERALRFDPDNPVALVTLAETKRIQLFELTTPQERQAASPENAANETSSEPTPLPALSPPAADPEKDTAEIKALREQIRTLARRAIANDPLNASAFRLLAEVSNTPDEARILMQEAIKRSRREPIAAFWLMADSFEREDFPDAVAKADILLKTQSGLSGDVMRYLGALTEIPEGRPVLAASLMKQPGWRERFFHALPKNVRYAGTPFELMSDLKSSGSPPTSSELKPYLNVLMQAGLVQYAREIWGELRPRQRQGPLPLLTNADFAENPSGLPFDWSIRRGKNATLEFVSLGYQSGRAVRFDFGVGRVQFPELSQVIVLEPGHYRLDGEYRGSLRARRGLRWKARCWRGKQLGKTPMLLGRPGSSWQSFSLNFDVPDQEDCQSQQLQLFHDARSASEKFVSGHLSFRRLKLKRVGL